METIILANINFIVLVLLYKFILSKNGIPKWNRWLLISLPLVALMLTFVQLIPEANHHIYQVELPLVTVEQVNGQQIDSGFSLSTMEWVYALGILIFGLLNLWGLMQIYQMVRKSTFMKKMGAVSVYKAPINASFGKTIFVKDNISENEVNIIIKHEIAHVNQWHTIDKIYSIIVQLFVWFNPVVYIWQKLIDKNHEYLADEEVLESESLENYSLFLLQQKMQTNITFSTAPISKMSHLKSRIMKMKSKSKNQNKMKNSKFNYLWIPACLLVLSIGSISAKQMVENESENVTEVYQNTEDPDVMPEFTGGQQAMMQFLMENIKYPESAKENDIEGTVFIAFVVNSKGKVTKANVKKSAEKSLDDEALRVINKMPKWTPGEKDGKKVNVEMVLPIKFKLPKEDKKEKK